MQEALRKRILLLIDFHVSLAWLSNPDFCFLSVGEARQQYQRVKGVKKVKGVRSQYC